jgi:hypothetical protein
MVPLSFTFATTTEGRLAVSSISAGVFSYLMGIEMCVSYVLLSEIISQKMADIIRKNKKMKVSLLKRDTFIFLHK